VQGELPAGERMTVEAHLKVCPSCQGERERLGDALAPDRPEVAGNQSSSPELLTQLLSLIRKQAGSESERRLVVLKLGIRSRVGPFLGPQATERVLQSASGDGGKLLSTLEPMLAMFIGRRAARLLIDQVVSAAHKAGSTVH
jgi:hypothetical protein